MTTPIGKGFRSLNLTLRKVRKTPGCMMTVCDRTLQKEFEVVVTLQPRLSTNS